MKGDHMKKLQRAIAGFTLLTLLLSTTTAFADDNAFRETLQDAFYGGAIGTLVGAAFMAFTKKPADHFEYMAYGAATGVLVGTAYGVAKSARAMASIENGKVKIAMPTIIPIVTENNANKQITVSWHANLLHGTFN